MGIFSQFLSVVLFLLSAAIMFVVAVNLIGWIF